MEKSKFSGVIVCIALFAPQQSKLLGVSDCRQQGSDSSRARSHGSLPARAMWLPIKTYILIYHPMLLARRGMGEKRVKHQELKSVCQWAIGPSSSRPFESRIFR